mgnify:CR=1 FL=1
MNRDKVNKAIKNILEIIFSKTDFQLGDGLYSFKYTGNIKTEDDRDKIATNPSLVIYGQQNVKRYEENYKVIYEEICKSYKLSFKTFKDLTQNLIFENKFDIENILLLVKDKEESKFFSFRKIYGLSCACEETTLGKYTFVPSSKIEEFINKNFNQPAETKYPSIIKRMKNEKQPENGFVYFICPVSAIDANFAQLQIDIEISQIIKLISFICSKLPDRYYVGDIPPKTYIENSIVLDKDGYGSMNSSFKRKDLYIDISDEYFKNSENGFDKLWNIFSKENTSSFENRIIESIIWFGNALLESDWKKSLVQISFAFETLLLINQNEFISKSITASMAESFALIVGSSCEERIQLEKEFKDFYKNRSGIVHGGKIDKECNNLNKYIKMFYQTIEKILVDSRFKDCFQNDNLYEILQIEKYS